MKEAQEALLLILAMAAPAALALAIEWHHEARRYRALRRWINDQEAR